MLNTIYIFFSGLLMGMADTMPGISGSTIIYILGVYEKFILSLSTLFNTKTFKTSFVFLVKLGLGWIIGALFSLTLITLFMEKNIYFITSLFLGLVIVSIPITFKEAFGDFKIKTNKLLYMVMGFLLVVIIFFLGQNLIGSINVENIFIMYTYVFVVAMVAISSMLLPGISGSTILLISGIYYPIISILTQIASGDITYLNIVVIFVLGVLSGLFTVAKIINRAFKSNEENMIYFIEGLLVGSILPIVYAPISIKTMNYLPLNFQNFSFVGFGSGIIMLFALTLMRSKQSKLNVEGN